MRAENFKKKVYKKLESSPFAESISLSHTPSEGAPKKIIPSRANKGLREEFKKTFLPLLIDIFELRQIIDNYKSNPHTCIQTETISKSPQKILERLEQLQGDVEESKRWCEGVVLQIAKGIEEAKEALELMRGEREEGILKRLLRKISK